MSFSKPCYFCNVKKELRPYGPKGELLCFGCAMAPDRLKTTEKMFELQLTATDDVMVLDGSELGPYPAKHNPDVVKIINQLNDR